MLMLKDAGGFWWLMFNLGQAKESLEHGTTPDPEVIKALYGFVGKTVYDFPVSKSLKDQAKRLDERLGQAMNPSDLPVLADRVGELVANLSTELSEDLYLLIGSHEKDAFLDPWAWFGKDTLRAFPALLSETRACVRCLVFHEWTASIYHAMIVFQSGLHWLADQLGLTFPNSIDVESWGTIIERIESEIRKLSQQPKTTARDEQLAFYSLMASHFFYVKEAWRNFVSHGRRHYDEREAREIVDNVRGFMSKVAESILPPPVRVPPPPL